MSTSAQQVPSLTATVERRFYPRIVPQAPIFVAFNENESEASLLLNVSENGLLLSTPAQLTCNFVARLSLSLNGLPKPVHVTVRVLWTSEAGNMAGIQLLDLHEHDRQQIRKWGAREFAQSMQPETDQRLLVAPPSTCSSETDHTTTAFTEDAPLSASGENVALAPTLIVRTRPLSTVERRAMRAIFTAAVFLAAAVLLIKAAPGNPFARFKSMRSADSAAEPPSQETHPTPQTPEISNRAAASQAPAPPDDTAAPKRAPITDASPHHDSAKTMQAPSKAPSDENPADTQSDLSLTTALPAATEVVRERSSASPQSVAVAEVPSEVIPEMETLSPPDPATPLQPLPIPTRPANLSASTSATIPLNTPSSTSLTPSSSPIVAPAPTRPAFSAQSAAPVIQMDAPPSHVLEVHLPSGHQASFLNLPGERVIESPAVTIHIQRSVLMRASGGWFANRTKKVVVGELISRADPQATQIPTTSAPSVRVKATVSKDGRIENVNQILGPANLAPAVAKALHEWRYQPTLVDNKPVETQCYVVFQFHAPSYRAAKR
jgi:hypothetical protein